MAGERILVVEDDIIIVMELESRLQELGYAVCAVTDSGEEAVEKSDEMQPDLVLMDIRLKGAIDGIEAAAEIRSRTNTPVVYLTAHADGDTLQRAKITEPYGYIIKPFEERDLHTAIEMALYKHRMEKRLREREQWLATTLTSIGDAMIASDEWGRISLLNPVAERLIGCQKEEVMGEWLADVFAVIQEEASGIVESPIAQTLREGTVVDLARHLLLTQDGREIPIDGSTAPITDEQGRTTGVVLVFRDISAQRREEEERAELQAQLFQAQKMEAVGVLTGQLAHSLNNLMMTVVGFSSLLLSDLGDKEAQHQGLEFVKRAGEQAAFLTRQILSMSRRPTATPKVLDLNALMADMEEMVQTMGGEGVEVRISLDPDLWHIQADPAEIEQVILNLVLNAQQAMPEGGELLIRTENVTVDKDQKQQVPEAYPGTFVCLSVADTGSGMSQETLDRIFEPFFSTKEKGTGLGLPIAQRITRQYGGWMEAWSTLAEGSTFEVHLPACFDDVEPESQATMALTDARGAGERILLVEDDEGVRAAVCEMLRAGGYVALEATSVAEALHRFETEEGRVDLLFSDLVLPDGDGLQLVEHLCASSPGLRVLLTSGYTDERVQWSLLNERGFRLLQKPFGVSELLPALREALAEDPP